MNREALIQLERVVRGAPEELFNMHTFAEDTSCGTIRCAAGWAAVDPWFQNNCLMPPHYNTTYLADAFMLNEDDTDNLFGGWLDSSIREHNYPKRLRRDVSKLEVIANIRRLLRGERALPYAATQRD